MRHNMFTVLTCHRNHDLSLTLAKMLLLSKLNHMLVSGVNVLHFVRTEKPKKTLPGNIIQAVIMVKQS